MPCQELYASIRVQLPEEATAAAVRNSVVAQAWANFVSEINADTNTDDVQMSLTINEARAPRHKRPPRRPRLVVGSISMPNPDDAA